MKIVLTAIVVALAFAGCAQTEPIAPGAPAIVLDETQTRSHHVGSSVITFPKGRYEADFQTAKGIYYRAPTSMSQRALGIHVVQTGGLFIPNGKAQRQASWLESANGHTYALEEPVTFHYAP